MTLNKAIDKAIRLAKIHEAEYFVVYEPEEGYCTASDFDMHTFFLGNEIVSIAYPNGDYTNGSIL